MASLSEASIRTDFPFESHYLEVKGSRMHYIEEGEGDPILFLHGNPTSSYLWRNIIPHLTDRGRCIAPDLIGMGKSDKPDIAYRFFDHYAYLEAFIEKMGLERITLVIHDWGSGLGFHYAAEHPEKIKGIAFMEAIFRPMVWSAFPRGYRIGFQLMRMPYVGWFMISVGNFFISQLMPNAIARKLTQEELAHYNAPYPDVKSRKPIRVWPQEIPIEGKPKDVHEAVSRYREWLKESPIPKILFYGEPGGLIDAQSVAWIEEHFPNTETYSIGKGIHYLQEDNPHGIGEKLAEWYRRLA